MSVLVLNASYEPLQSVSVPHAIRMLVRGVAVVEEVEEGRTMGHFPVPRVLRLVRYVVARWRHGRPPPWSKRGVHRRDRGLCAYCGSRGHTIDHVVPRSRGGQDTWENTVLACSRCNTRKANRTPPEAGLTLRTRPRVPRWEELLHPSR
jgi:5-methylcytosine-specific restriction endonuclease McrA